jgi:hypothetical protein
VEEMLAVGVVLRVTGVVMIESLMRALRIKSDILAISSGLLSGEEIEIAFGLVQASVRRR